MEKYHKLVGQILELLKQNSLWHETFEHEAVTTSEEAARVRTGYTLEQGAKAIIAKVEYADKKEELVMFVLPANLRLDSKKIKTALGIKGFRFATPEEIDKLAPGLERGGVPPFGNLMSIKVFCDPKLPENEKIIFNAGDRRFSIAMKSGDYIKIINPIMLTISEEQ